MAEVMFYGGLRRSEVLSLTRTSLKTLEICGKRSKTRQFNLPLELIKRLRDYATDEVIFKLHPSTVNKIFVENSKRTGVKIHPHMLRHLFATHRLAYLEKTKQPGALKRVQMELGHANINTTSVYLHLVETMESVYQDYIADIKRRML
jgi:integrase/recombinase XerD